MALGTDPEEAASNAVSLFIAFIAGHSFLNTGSPPLLAICVGMMIWGISSLLFAQIDRSLERAQGGLGIGLTLVQRLVEMHGGTVAVSSAGLAQGSEFVIGLPLAG